MTAHRPDPDALLKQARAAESASRRGRLKIFFGAAPGVGKTFAMLSAARTLATRGVDVVVGIVETHGRSETESLLLGMEILPRRDVEYRGTTLHELDLEAALARKPELLLVDEFAHTNAPGSRHEKRWQDVRALLDAGLDVATTLNVQHIESLNDVVAQISGVRVQETVPDTVIESADEVELVDLPPDALLERLRQGKVYARDMAERAMQSFFQKGNLAALRELALRRTAEWVDQQVTLLKHEQGATEVWGASERVLVGIGPAPSSATLLRSAKRLAVSLRAELIAVYVESRADDRLSAADRERVLEHMRLAESLGAETLTLKPAPGRRISDELIDYARRRNVSKILLGKPSPRGLRDYFIGSPVDRLIRASGEIDVFVVHGERGGVSHRTITSTLLPYHQQRNLRAYIEAVVIAGVFIALASLFYDPPDLATEAMVCLLGIVLAAGRSGKGPAIVAAILSVCAFNVLFTEPRFTFFIHSMNDTLTVFVMLVVGVLVGSLTARIREQALVASERERRTAALYAMTRELAAARDTADVLAAAGKHIRETFSCGVAVLVFNGSDLKLHPGDPAAMTLNDAAMGVARWTLDHGKAAGKGTSVLPSSGVLCLPLIGSRGKAGVLVIDPGDDESVLSPARLRLLDTFAQQVALALERAGLIRESEEARVRADTERLRSTLLASVSHDLRTPLAAIAGSASTLREAGNGLDDRTRAELTDSIVEEADRLNRLIANLLFATRLESGSIEPAREWCSMEEIIGSALNRVSPRLAGRSVRTSVPSDLPLMRVDATMMEQALINLLENVARHTDAGTPIGIMAYRDDGSLIVAVEDDGPGLAPGEEKSIFRRFVRGARGSTGGSGLGLAICDGIMRIHGGRIWAENKHPRGAVFRLSLPIEAQPTIAPEPGREFSNART